ncbi:MAG: hypothetical protein QGH20_08465 [Candidatus Latescibacteria bacterium]|nr:hypothetical protein [Candidatus Latescibacterota bacterium]
MATVVGCGMVQRSGDRYVITSAEFDPEVIRLGKSGDNWCMIWAADGDIYTSMDDGLGWKPYDVRKEFFNNKIYRISGGPDAAIDHEQLARITDGMSGADIANICRQAGLVCIKDAVANSLPIAETQIKQEHLLSAYDQCTNGLRTVPASYSAAD